jgi:hypothetical protein
MQLVVCYCNIIVAKVTSNKHDKQNNFSKYWKGISSKKPVKEIWIFNEIQLGNISCIYGTYCHLVVRAI